MKTYAQVQNKTKLSRSIAGETLQRKKQIALSKPTEGINLDGVSVKGVLQGAFKVRESKILADILDEDLRSRVFKEPTKIWITQNMNNIVNQKENYIKTHRENIKFAKLSPHLTINNWGSAIDWLNKEPLKEHIYLYTGSTIYGGISGFNNSSDKNPHPTILGDDPEVDFAGIVRQHNSKSGDKTNTIIINNDSGHYPVEYEENCGGAKGVLSGILKHHYIASQKVR